MLRERRTLHEEVEKSIDDLLELRAAPHPGFSGGFNWKRPPVDVERRSFNKSLDLPSFPRPHVGNIPNVDPMDISPEQRASVTGEGVIGSLLKFVKGDAEKRHVKNWFRRRNLVDEYGDVDEDKLFKTTMEGRFEVWNTKTIKKMPTLEHVGPAEVKVNTSYFRVRLQQGGGMYKNAIIQDVRVRGKWHTAHVYDGDYPESTKRTGE